jgi:hypothetical protein
MAYVPAMSDASVKAKTGKDWAGWFAALDKAGAAKLDHKSIAALISKQYSIPGWWCQNVTVEYERARGLRVPHQTMDGFSVGVSKTIDVSLSRLYAATVNATQRTSISTDRGTGAHDSTSASIRRVKTSRRSLCR